MQIAHFMMFKYLCLGLLKKDRAIYNICFSSFQLRNHILYLIENYQTVVIVGETGCGKSTQIPQVSIYLNVFALLRLIGRVLHLENSAVLCIIKSSSQRKYSTQLVFFIKLLGFIISLISTEVTVISLYYNSYLL